MKNANEPAFPTSVGKDSDFGYSVGGLTKREYFAAKAMQGLCSTFTIGRDQPELQTGTAEAAVKYADAILAELAKNPEAP